MGPNERTTTLLLAMWLCLVPLRASAGATPAFAQTPAPEHKFWDAENVAIQSISAIMMAADLATTKRALEAPGTHELNPLAQSPAARYTLKFAAFGAGLGLAYAMHKTGHHQAERIIPLLFGVPSGVGAVHNAGIHR